MIDREAAGRRLDQYLSQREDASRSAAQKWIEDGLVTVNGKTVSKSYKLSEGDMVEFTRPEAKPMEAKAEDLPLEIVYQDDYLAVVNKPKEMVVHPAPGNAEGTLVNALLYHLDNLSGINGVIRPGIVHRIDKNTSGLLIVAKEDKAHIGLAEQIKEHSFTRKYRAIVVGNLKDDMGTVDKPIDRHPVNRQKMAVVQGGREAVTHYCVLERLPGFTYVELTLETGRTHQIRVHMASLGHPVMGDTLYGGGKTEFEKKNAKILKEQCLHACHIGFVHPITGEQLSFDAVLPGYFEEVLKKLRRMS
ncbi:MAG: RluA family pseudouridine synthase [Ruminococcaceae bacterium]|nr:RluA family pseudouridine synthase [Oscillospiraceae bacterium]